MAASYQIVDEPSPGRLARLAVSPLWPLFAVMFAGGWLAWPWFLLNGAAIGSSSRRREALYAAFGIGGVVVATGLLLAGVAAGLPAGALPYLLIVPVVIKLGAAYALYSLQHRSFELYQHFGGSAANGLVVVLLGAFIGRRAVLELGAGAPAWLEALWVQVLS